MIFQDEESSHKMADLFSIILPVHNGGSYIKECVASILTQTYSSFNLVVLENKSTDGTYEWLQTITDKRVLIIPSDELLSIEENWGRIKSIETNEFITLIGHDDILYPQYLQKMFDLIQQHPKASIYQAHFDYIDAGGKKIRVCMPMEEKQDAADFLGKQFNRTMDSTGTGYMFRKKDYDELGGINTGYPRLIFADYELWVRLTLLSYKATLEVNSFAYRIHQSASTTTNGKDYIEAFIKYIRFLISLKRDKAISNICDKYGKEFLLYFCESLSHRLLKTNTGNVNNSVNGFIETCKDLAIKFIPDQEFKPMDKMRIRLARYLDGSRVTRKAFQKLILLRKN